MTLFNWILWQVKLEFILHFLLEYMMQIPIMYGLLTELPVTQFLITAIILLAVIYYMYATRHHGVCEKLGVPGPKPWPITDHQTELKKGPNAAIRKWFLQYGNTFGAYGLIPHCAVLVTKDLSLMRQVLLKDFDNFVERKHPRLTISSLKHGVLEVSGSKWSRNRRVTSPMFTGARMRLILKHVCDSAETLARLTKQKSSKGQLIPAKLFASKFATEVIARVAFGVGTHAGSEQETEFAYHARKLLNFETKFHSVVDTIYQYFPHIIQLLGFFNIHSDFIDKHADEYFVRLLDSTIADRQRRNQKGETVRDLLDMLIDAGEETTKPSLKDMDSGTLSHAEIVGNATTLILAGVDTVSKALQSILYCLALHEDIQEKVIDEIDLVFPKGTSVNYDQLKELKYTEQVINECLRLFQLISTIMRLAAENKTYGQLTIPKGTYVHITLGEIMKDPEHWPDPEKFHPDRFSPENKVARDPLTFVPFGYGPRTCLGMRLAMMELKTVLVYLLRECRFSLSGRTEPKKGETLLTKDTGIVVACPVRPIELEVVSRQYESYNRMSIDQATTII